MAGMELSEGLRQEIAFVGHSLGPFFRFDPLREAQAIEPSYAAIAQLDARAAACEWPFVEEEAAFRALRLMQEGLAGALEPGGAALTDRTAPVDCAALAGEYRRLFVGPGHKAAAPWGSVYTDKDGVMFGGSWLALREWMRANGLAVSTGAPREPEDHIGLLLDMMAWLAEERPELLCDFLRLHLLTWSGHFLELMEREAQHAFFEGLAQLAQASLRGIQERLGLQVQEPRFYR